MRYSISLSDLLAGYQPVSGLLAGYQPVSDLWVSRVSIEQSKSKLSHYKYKELGPVQ